MGSMFCVCPLQGWFIRLQRELPDVKYSNGLRLVPLPRMDQYIKSLEEATVLSTLQATSEYWIIEIDGRDGVETAFPSHHGI